jgi:hypothetical protein
VTGVQTCALPISGAQTELMSISSGDVLLTLQAKSRYPLAKSVNHS